MSVTAAMVKELRERTGAGMDRQYHEGQIGIEQPKLNREIRVDQMDGFRNGANGNQPLVHRPVVADQKLH